MSETGIHVDLGQRTRQKAVLPRKHKHHEAKAFPLPDTAFLRNRQHPATEEQKRSCLFPHFSLSWETCPHLLTIFWLLMVPVVCSEALRSPGEAKACRAQPLGLSTWLDSCHSSFYILLWEATAVLYSHSSLLNRPQCPYTDHLEEILFPSLLFYVTG